MTRSYGTSYQFESAVSEQGSSGITTACTPHDNEADPKGFSQRGVGRVRTQTLLIMLRNDPLFPTFLFH
jgi:hypothetical protein